MADTEVADLPPLPDITVGDALFGYSADAMRSYARRAVKAATGAEAYAISEVGRQLLEREERGRAKYGATLDRTDLHPREWLQHLAEELLDGAGYALAAKRALQDLPPQGLTEFLDWVADELIKRDTQPGTFAPGVAASLRGRAHILRAAAKQEGQTDG